MRFENLAPVTGKLLRSGLPQKDQMLCTVVAKSSGVFDLKGNFEMDVDTEIPYFAGPQELALGTIPGDMAIRKDGVDIMAIGYAYHPNIDGGPSSVVSVQVNRDRRMLRVFGERTWYKTTLGRWAISEPEHFSKMEMKWENSYGGEALDEWANTIVHPLNLNGKGYVFDEDDVEDTDLPNIEDADQLIQSWQDQPKPCNICPSLTAFLFEIEQHTDKILQTDQVYKVPASFGNHAHPKFRFAAIAPGDLISLEGMCRQGKLRFEMPNICLEATISLGQSRQLTLPLILDTILFLPETRRCVFTWRKSVRYAFIPQEERVLVLRKVS